MHSAFTFNRVAWISDSPIPASAAREWLRLLDASEDALLARLTEAAITQAEGLLGRAIRHARYVQHYDTIGPRERVRLARPPFLTLESVEEWDTDTDAWVALDESTYVVRTDGVEAVVVPVDYWPQGVPVRFTFTSGHEANAPADITQAVLDLVAHMYEHRGDTPDAPAAWMMRHGSLRAGVL